jgi:hypothetical protein
MDTSVPREVDPIRLGPRLAGGVSPMDTSVLPHGGGAGREAFQEGCQKCEPENRAQGLLRRAVPMPKP